MSLIGALHTGSTGLAVSRAALEVTGNNLANAATEGYSRQRAVTAASRGVEVRPGTFIGSGTRLQEVRRVVDEALLSRLRSAVSDHSAAGARGEVLTQIETIGGALSDRGLSSQLNQFLNAWSQLANNPTDSGLRSMVVAEGERFADFLNGANADLGELRRRTDESIASGVETADGLLDRIASLNRKIVTTERGRGGAGALRDERDRLLKDLSGMFDISTAEQPNGSMDVFVHSVPVVLADRSRGLTLDRETVGDEVEIRLRVEADGATLEPSGGRLGSLIQSREEDINGAIGALDEFAHGFISELNRLHASGQGERGFEDLTGAAAVADPAAALDSEEAGLPFPITNGSFLLTVTRKSTGTPNTTRIEVDLGPAGGGMSLNDLAAEIDGVANVSAAVDPSGRLRITADSSDFDFRFADDSSGALASLGINTFFTGTAAGGIAVNSVPAEDPALLAVARDRLTGDNRTALAIAGMGDRPVERLGGLSPSDFWRRHVEDFAIRTDQTSQETAAGMIVLEGLDAQRQSVSGVNIDEEAINMLIYQRAFQSSARFISVVDELMQTMLTLVN